MTIGEAIVHATARLAEAGVAEPRREASSLLAFSLGRASSFLIAHPEYVLSDREARAFEVFLVRREAREPFQYITGHQEFWGLEFEVGPGVLIPRPETEILVETAIRILKRRDTAIFAEAGVGSGCISVSILHAIPESRAFATDVSQAALSIAVRNAARHGVASRVELRQADLFEGVDGTFDLVVSNPPYIPDADITELQPEVRDFEPITALAGGPDGLDIVRRIVADSRHLLGPGGVLMLEIGQGQATAVKGLFDPDVWQTSELLADLQGIDRVVVASTHPALS
jgi:release factor glutamine methyltransferase